MLIGGNMAVADYKVVVVQSSGKKEAIIDIARLEYTDTINQMRTFSVTIGKANKNDYSKFNSYEVVSGVETGVIYIYRKGNLELAGIIEKPTYDKFGRLVLKGVGMEVKIEWKGTGINKTYSNTSLDTIVSDMIGDISEIDLGTNEASSKGNLKEVNISGMSYLDGLNHAIVDLGGNEWYMTYSDSGNSSFNNVQYRGSNTSIGTLVEGIDISNVQRTKDTQRIFNKVTAIGRSEGETLISVTRQATDVDASYDMSKYGTREPSKPLVNKRIQTEEDLTKYADNFLKQHMYPVETINFDMNDVDYPCSVGDVVTIRSGAKLQEGGEEYKRELRIISKKRIVTPNSERLVIGVTRKGLNTLPTDISTRWKRIEDIIISHQTTNQCSEEYANKNINTKVSGLPFTIVDGKVEIGTETTRVKYIYTTSLGWGDENHACFLDGENRCVWVHDVAEGHWGIYVKTKNNNTNAAVIIEQNGTADALSLSGGNLYMGSGADLAMNSNKIILSPGEEIYSSANNIYLKVPSMNTINFLTGDYGCQVDGNGGFKITDVATGAIALSIIANCGDPNYALWVQNNHANPWAAMFEGYVNISGDLDVSGTVSKGGGSFKIDHPLDPKNKILMHSFVEAPEMLLIYRGTITCNKFVKLKMPDYFWALNKNISVQVTPINDLSLVSYRVDEKKKEIIILSEKKVEVSYTIYGIRKDKFALSNPLVVEQNKENPGYIHPDCFKDIDPKAEKYYTNSEKQRRIRMKEEIKKAKKEI